MATYESLQARHQADFAQLLPEYTHRIDWPRAGIEAAQEAGLRRIVAAAQANSPWHADRLRATDASGLTRDGLAQLPTMSKPDLMANWDGIVTDPRLTLDRVSEHLERLTDDAYLLDEYHAVASGGSSGLRGVFVYGWEAWAVCYASSARWLARRAARAPDLAGTRLVQATVSAELASHITSATVQTFSSAAMPVRRFPVTLPLNAIVAGLNGTQPVVLQGYSSALHRLAGEAKAGRLAIAPRLIVTRSEPLLPEVRAALEGTWNAPVMNYWGTSEGGATGMSCGEATGVHLSEDLLIIEAVDAAGQPVAPGETATKVYLTNLYNETLPLIRYEIDDEVTLVDGPCPCGSLFARAADPLGRADDAFVYNGNLSVHPHVFRSHLSRERHVIEYQVRQTLRGAEIAIRCGGAANVGELERAIARQLAAAGLRDPEVSVIATDDIARSGAGKLQRFVPLASAAVQ